MSLLTFDRSGFVKTRLLSDQPCLTRNEARYRFATVLLGFEEDEVTRVAIIGLTNS